MSKQVKIIFIANAAFTFAGGIILLLFPARLMATFGLQPDARQFFVYYLLGASAFALALFSYLAIKVSDIKSQSYFAYGCLSFHAITAIVGIVTLLNGFDKLVIVNILAHLVFTLFFLMAIKSIGRHS